VPVRNVLSDGGGTVLEPLETLGLDHVDLSVNDLQRSLAFYAPVLEFLGFRKQPDLDTDVWANSHLSIAVRAASTGRRGEPFDRHRVGLHHLAFRARTRADVDRFHEFLVEKQLPVLDPPCEYPQYGTGYYAVFFADPDGIKLELVYFPWGYWRRVLEQGRDARPRDTGSQTDAES